MVAPRVERNLFAVFVVLLVQTGLGTKSNASKPFGHPRRQGEDIIYCRLVAKRSRPFLFTNLPRISFAIRLKTTKNNGFGPFMFSFFVILRVGLRINLVRSLTRFLSFCATASIYIANLRVSLEFIGSHNRVPMASTVERSDSPPAQGRWSSW